MLFRVASLTRNLTRVSQHVPVMGRSMSGYTPSHWLSDKDIDQQTNAHMDKLPVPEGAWDESYRQNQTKYNVQLLVSVGLMAATIAAMFQTNCFNFNSHPPMKNED